MIENERQYRVTRAKLAELEKSLSDVTKGAERFKPRIAKALRDAVESQVSELRREVSEYEELCQQRTQRLTLSSLDELGDCLIKARIFRGYTQAELGDRLSLHAQQIQRYEATKFESARVSRLIEIMEALAVSLRGTIELDSGADVSGGTRDDDPAPPATETRWISSRGNAYERELAGVGGDAARRAQEVIAHSGLWSAA
jgi:transcriptional regulator with XRE-family HTH domain